MPIIVVDPSPRGLDEIFDFGRLGASSSRSAGLEIHRGRGADAGGAPRGAAARQAKLLIGQSDMPKARLDRAPKLRAIINVETNFLQNVDYETCFERGIHVLAPSSAFAQAGRRDGARHGDRPLPGRDRRPTARCGAGNEKWLLDGADGLLLALRRAASA